MVDPNDAPAGYYAEEVSGIVSGCDVCDFYSFSGGLGHCAHRGARRCVRRNRADGLYVTFKRKPGIPGQPRAVQALLCD